MSTLLSELKARGCIHDASHFEELETALKVERLTFYCGFDPTSDSLHAGSMLPLIIMRRLQKAGHHPIVLIGSATGMIGDPSGKSEERVLLDEDSIQHNIAGIEKQIGLFLSAEGENPYTLLRNDSWLKKLGYIDFLRDVGKHFSVNAMIAKDSVRARLENREQGISYTEFSYMLLQAYDFHWLNKNMGCRLQVGGSDQWGNITAGLELIRRTSAEGKQPVFGLTFPLLTTSSGAKFGKTEKGAIYLDPNKTSAYEFYQYWYNTADADVIRYLSLFTDTQTTELERLKRGVAENPEDREAQRCLASELTTLVHGEEKTKQAIAAGQVLFGAEFGSISSDSLLEIFKDVPSVELDQRDFVSGIPLQELLVTAKVAASKGAARRLVEGGGVSLNNERVSNFQELINADRFVDGKILVIRSGKKNYSLIKVRA